MKTSSSKADLLSELRDKYISKYGTEPEIQNTINEQLETLKAKSKLTIKDLTDIETTISNTSKVVLSKSSSASNLQPLQSLKGGVEPNLNSIRLPTLDIRSPNQRKIVSNRYNTDRGYDNSILELSDVNGLSPSIKYTSSPFALNKLRGSKSPLAFSTPTANMLTDLSGFGVNFEKTEQYVINIILIVYLTEKRRILPGKKRFGVKSSSTSYSKSKRYGIWIKPLFSTPS